MNMVKDTLENGLKLLKEHKIKSLKVCGDLDSCYRKEIPLYDFIVWIDDDTDTHKYFYNMSDAKKLVKKYDKCEIAKYDDINSRYWSHKYYYENGILVDEEEQ